MNILFPASFADKSIPDASFQDEMELAGKCHNVHLVSSDLFSSLESFNSSNLLRKFMQADEPTPILYRGWMLNAVQYQALNLCLRDRNYELITAPKQYFNCHYLDQWYPLIKDYTPFTVSCAANLETASEALELFGDKPIFIKDSVASQKYRWHEAAYIPKASDKNQALSIIENFLRIQKEEWTEINGYLILREFVSLKQIGKHSKCDLPLAQEFRNFIYRGKVVSCHPRWSEGEYLPEKPPISLVEEIAAKIDSPFFTVDIALTQDNNWICIEIGDGQVSDFDNKTDLQNFYENVLSES
jgi:hypothetical protein